MSEKHKNEIINERKIVVVSALTEEECISLDASMNYNDKLFKKLAKL